ncbi:hypothetical protein [Ensifer adhaerens]|uniref:hypothetical protein n=1 Tax=Ensifer adhaerens TaxID=106592 RepID=UPI00131A397A|nr:hypothetical protein [Ensifer adhaerens]
MDDEGLVFVWEKARLSRPTGNPLPKGCQDDPHPVGKVAEQPDYDAPIRYTQSGRNRSAAIYVPDTTASPTSGGGAQQAQPATDPNVNPGTGTENKGDGAQGKINGNSRFRTIFLNSDNIPTPIDVNLDLSVENDTLNVNLKVEPSYLKVALGSMGWVQSGDFVANVEAIYSAAKEKDLEVLVTEPTKVLGSEDIAWIPNVSKTESLLLLSTGKEVFSSEIGLGLKAGIGATMHLRTATLFILDGDNGLIGTGAYSALTPE